VKVFISWSGKRSQDTAELLCSWIRKVIQAAEPWISVDIEKGSRWNDAIKHQLEESKMGIICITKDNLQSEWLLFEAGALSKTNDAQVCTFLLDVSAANIKLPLGQFQHTASAQEDIRKLMHTINNKIIKLGEKTIPEKEVDEVFDMWYPQLNEKLSIIQHQIPEERPVERLERDILEEILQEVRGQKNDQAFLNNVMEKFETFELERLYKDYEWKKNTTEIYEKHQQELLKYIAARDKKLEDKK